MANLKDKGDTPRRKVSKISTGKNSDTETVDAPARRTSKEEAGRRLDTYRVIKHVVYNKNGVFSRNQHKKEILRMVKNYSYRSGNIIDQDALAAVIIRQYICRESPFYIGRTGNRDKFNEVIERIDIELQKIFGGEEKKLFRVWFVLLLAWKMADNIRQNFPTKEYIGTRHQYFRSIIEFTVNWIDTKHRRVLSSNGYWEGIIQKFQRIRAINIEREQNGIKGWLSKKNVDESDVEGMVCQFGSAFGTAVGIVGIVTTITGAAL